jgi:predicted Rossmann-fold nucleotide-binding protein
MTHAAIFSKEVVVASATPLSEIITAFKHERGIHCVIAISGGSDSRPEGIDDEKLEAQWKDVMERKEQAIIGAFMRRLQGYRIGILCGGTKWGVPKRAATEAKRFGLTTIGVYPLAGRKHALGPDLLDLRICVEPGYSTSFWGDESPLYAKLLDGVVVYGGGAGTLVEVAHILKINEALIDKDEKPKLIVPLSATGGVADGVPFLWGKADVRKKTIPANKIVSGTDAAQLLINELNLDDFLEI